MTALKVRHVYEHDASRFETTLNETLRWILERNGTVADIKYASDAATADNHRGGFGALVIYEVESDA